MSEVSMQEDLWTPYKELENTVWKYLNQSKEELNTAEFENVLRKHKQNFFTMLQNPPPNPKSREELLRATTEGVQVRGFGRHVISDALYRESLQLSEMFQLDELHALDLLCAAQTQLPFHGGLERLLVAVLLYFDGRRALASALLLLVQARKGVTWRVECRPDVAAYVTKYTDQLMDADLVDRLLSLLSHPHHLDPSHQFDILLRYSALGDDVKHRRRLSHFLQDTRRLLADTIFTWSTQCGLPASATLSLIRYLADRPSLNSQERLGRLDLTQNTDLKDKESPRDDFKRAGFVDHSFHNVGAMEGSGQTSARNSSVNFSLTNQRVDLTGGYDMLGDSLDHFKKTGQFESNKDILNVSSTRDHIDDINRVGLMERHSGVVDDVDLLLVMALVAAVDGGGAWRWREEDGEVGEEVIGQLPIVSDSGFLPRVVGEFLRGQDEEWGNEGLQALSYFSLSVTLTTLRDTPHPSIPHPPHEIINHVDNLFSISLKKNLFHHLFHCILPNKLIYTEEFIFKRLHNLFTDFISHSFPKIKELRLKSDEIARTLQLYEREGLTPPQHLPHHYSHLLLSLGRFYENTPTSCTQLITQFWNETRPHQPTLILFKFVRLSSDVTPSTQFCAYLRMLSGLASSTGTARCCFEVLRRQGALLSPNLTWDHFFASFARYYDHLRTDVAGRSGFRKAVSPQEVEALHAVLLLIRTVANYDEQARSTFCEHTGWSAPATLLGLVACPMPIPLKADLMATVASLSNGVDNAALVWELLEASQIIVTTHATSSYMPRGVQTELEEIETRLEEYPLTLSTLKLLRVLCRFPPPPTLGCPSRPPGLTPHLTFIFDHVFLKHRRRPYRSNLDRWRITYNSLELIDTIIECCPLEKTNVLNRFDSKSESSRVLYEVIDEINSIFNRNEVIIGEEILKKCLKSSLSVINRLKIIDLSLNFYVTLFELLSHHSIAPDSVLIALEIIGNVSINRSIHDRFKNQLLIDEKLLKSIRNSMIECLDSEDLIDIKKSIIRLLIDCLGFDFPSLSHLLIDFDSDFSILDALVRLSSKENCCESIFQLFYLLSSDSKSSEKILNRLRRDRFYFRNRLISCFENSDFESVTWILKTLAIDIKTSAESNRVSFLREIIDFLIDYPEKKVDQSFDLVRTSKFDSKTSFPDVIPLENFLTRLIRFFAIKAKDLSIPTFDYFDSNALETIFDNCRMKIAPKIVDIKKLHAILNEELKNFSRIPAIAIEVEKILKFACDFNKSIKDAKSLAEFSDSWRQIAEILIIFVPNEILPEIYKEIAIFSFLKCLLDNYEKFRSNRQVSAYISGACVVFVRNLRYLGENVDGSSRNVGGQSRNISEKKSLENVFKTYRSALRDILENLMRWLIDEDVVEVRINLYATIIAFLQLAEHDSQRGYHEIPFGKCKNLNMTSKNYENRSQNYESCAITSINYQNRVQQNYGNRSVTFRNENQQNYGNLSRWPQSLGNQQINYDIGSENLVQNPTTFDNNSQIEMTSTSLDVQRRNFDRNVTDSESSSVLSCVLDEVYSIWGEKLLEVACRDGAIGQELSRILSLSCISHSLQLSRNSRWLSLLTNRGYLREIIMSLEGSDGELRSSLGGDLKPVFLYTAKMELLSHFSFTSRGAQALLEEKLLVTLARMSVFSLRPQLSKGVFEGEFLPSKEEIYFRLWFPVLHLSNSLITSLGEENVGALEQIECFLISNSEVVEFILRSGSVQLPVVLMEELALVTSLLARGRGGTRGMRKLAMELLGEFSSVELISLFALRVAVNLADLGRKLTSEWGVVFRPELEGEGETPPLGVAVKLLINAVAVYQRGKTTRGGIFEELRKVEMEFCGFLVESSLFLIWTHLDFFMSKSIPRTGIVEFGISKNYATLSSSSEASWKITADVIGNLKHGLVSLFNDSFTKRLLETAQDRSECDRGFVDALLRKIKRLIQFVPVK